MPGIYIILTFEFDQTKNFTKIYANDISWFYSTCTSNTYRCLISRN